MRSVVSAAVAIIAVSAATAAAETRAWETVKRRLPEKLFAVAGADVDQLRASTVIQALMPELTARHPHAGTVIERAKTDCAIDLTAAVTGVVIALGDDERGLVIVSLRGLDERKVAACLEKVAKKDKTSFSTRKLPGRHGIVEYTRGKSHTVHVAWLAKDVAAIATVPGDQTLLEAMISGAGVGGALGDALWRFDHGAAAWGAIASDTFFEPDAKVKAGYATVTLAGGEARAQAGFVFHTAADAAKLGAELRKQLARKPSASIFPPELVKLFNAIDVVRISDTVRLRVTLPEGEVLPLLRLAHEI